MIPRPMLTPNADVALDQTATPTSSVYPLT